MNNWQPYPQNKPEQTTAAQMADYAVLVPNPNRVNKTGYNEHTPRYQLYLAFWLGDRFVGEDMRELNVYYYITLPSHS